MIKSNTLPYLGRFPRTKVAPEAEFAECVSDVILSLRNLISWFQGLSPNLLIQRVIPQSVPTNMFSMLYAWRNHWQKEKCSEFRSLSSKSDEVGTDNITYLLGRFQTTYVKCPMSHQLQLLKKL